MFTDPAFTLADQLFWIVDLFRKAMAADARTRGLGALSIAIWQRVKGFERRFCKLYAMWKAGTLPPPRPSASSAVKRLDRRERREAQSEGEGDEGRGVGAVAYPSPRPTGSSPVASLSHSGEGEVAAAAPAFDAGACDAGTLDRARLRPASVLPRAFRWLQRMLPSSAATLAAGVESLLGNYPEMKAFVAECPQVGRVLRPMCTMAGLRVPEWLALSKRVRKEDTSPRPSPHSGEGEVRGRVSRSDPSPRPSPTRGEGEVRRRRTAREIAEALVRRSERTGKPVDIRKVSSVVWGYIIHPPRDGNCPPPEIGYGGRWRKLPKDYKPPKDWE